MPSPESPPEVTVIVVSYNTRELTLKCLETLHKNTRTTRFTTVVLDNASADGSADAVAEHYPQVELIRSSENLGFAKANNIVAEKATTDWLLLLNPDTEVHPGAIDNLLAFSKSNIQAGITGGRTVFPDGSLNIASCWKKITPWSVFCLTSGLSWLFPKSDVFNPEAMGGWQRDSVREVDIVVGCFLMIQRSLWKQLGGFDLKYFMYGEEADLCLRAAALGHRPMITPDAQIMHLVGASVDQKADKTVLVAKAKVTLIRDHWSPPLAALGVGSMWLWGAQRMVASRLLVALPRGARHEQVANKWRSVWAKRRNWMAGY